MDRYLTYVIKTELFARVFLSSHEFANSRTLADVAKKLYIVSITTFSAIEIAKLLFEKLREAFQ